MIEQREINRTPDESPGGVDYPLAHFPTNSPDHELRSWGVADHLKVKFSKWAGTVMFTSISPFRWISLIKVAG
jgi:hypothetical protein